MLCRTDARSKTRAEFTHAMACKKEEDEVNAADIHIMIKLGIIYNMAIRGIGGLPEVNDLEELTLTSLCPIRHNQLQMCMLDMGTHVTGWWQYIWD